MGIIISFIKLSSQEKIFALESLFWVLIIRIMVWIFPFPFVKKSVQRIASSISKKDKNPDPSMPMQRIRLMIVGAVRYVPMATCLVQAMAGYLLFARHGYTTSIKIGVLTENGNFEAHAWLEKDNKIVLGESEKEFKTIMDIDRK